MRLLTRSDFDGIACGALLKELGIVDGWKFVHPKDLQDGLVEVTDRDVLANLPYGAGCKLWFDHHSSESERLGGELSYNGDSRLCDSAARVIYDYYNGDELLPQLAELVDAADKIASGKLSEAEIRRPAGWVLLGFLTDPRTGLGRFHHFRISNYRLMEDLVDVCRTAKADAILAEPDVAERARLYEEEQPAFVEMLKSRTRTQGRALVTDLRGVDPIHAGNRFLLYSLFPEQNVSLWVVDGKQRRNCSIAVGHSVLNRTCGADVGSLMLRYGGGGHQRVGTCQVAHEDVDRVVEELVEHLR